MAGEAQVHGAGFLGEGVLVEASDRAQVEAKLLGGIGFAPIAIGVVDQGDRELHRAGRLLERARCCEREFVIAAAARVVHHKGEHVIVDRGRVQSERIGPAKLLAKDYRDQRRRWELVTRSCGFGCR